MSAAQLAIGLTMLVVVNGIAACATQHIDFQMQAPATVNLKAKGVHALAVSDFDGPGESGTRMVELFTAKLTEGQHFKVAERQKMLAMEKEQALGMAGVVDEKMAAKAGKVLGVDALVVGKVSAYSVRNESYTKTVMKSRAMGTYRTECDKKGNCYEVENYEEVPVKEDHHIRSGTVAASYRVIRTETGEVLAGKQGTASYKYDTGNPPRGHKEELGQEEVLTVLSQQVVEIFTREIQPHQVTVDREFENGGWLFGHDEIKQGIEFMKANRPDYAAQRWEAVVKSDPRNSSAYYNLGVAYELTGNFEKADQAYRAAENIDPKSRYIQAVSNLKNEIERRRKLDEQKK